MQWKSPNDPFILLSSFMTEVKNSDFYKASSTMKHVQAILNTYLITR